MEGRRTKIDFSKHEVLIKKTDDLLIHHLKIPGTNRNNIKYINCNGILAVTGDYGNWIFCREFHPSNDGYVSDGYWHEKLQILSTQNATEFDSESTEKALKEKMAEYKEYYGEEAKKEVIEYYEGCLERCFDELDYTYFAYREQPRTMDYDDVIFLKDYKFWLKAVFDGFEEICRRIKENELQSN